MQNLERLQNIKTTILPNPNIDGKNFTQFILEVCDNLYSKIKDDYDKDKKYTDKMSFDEKYEYYSKKMNVIITICRHTAVIKKLSKKYFKNINNNNINRSINENKSSILYNRILDTIMGIRLLFIECLKEHPKYIVYKDKTFIAYSGMKTLPEINNNIIMNNNMINISISLPLSILFTYENYENLNSNNIVYNPSGLLIFKLKLDDFIIPTMNMCKLRIYEDLNLNTDSNNSKSDYNQPIHMEYELLYFGNQNLIITQHIPTCIIKYRDYKKYLYDNNFLLQKYSRTYNSVLNFLKWIKSNPDPTVKPVFDSLHGYINSLCGYLNYYLSFNYEQYYEIDYLKKLNFFFKNMINPFLYVILDNFDNTKYENNINQQKFINLLLIFINKWKENFDVNNTSKDSDKLFIEYANLLAIIYELIEYNISDNIITELVTKFITPRYNNIEFYYYKRTDVINVYFVELKNRVPKLNNIKNKLNNSTKKHTNNLTKFNNNKNTNTKTKTITN